MPLVSQTVEVGADAAAILGIVSDFEVYPQWNDEVKAVFARHSKLLAAQAGTAELAR